MRSLRLLKVHDERERDEEIPFFESPDHHGPSLRCTSTLSGLDLSQRGFQEYPIREGGFSPEEISSDPHETPSLRRKAFFLHPRFREMGISQPVTKRDAAEREYDPGLQFLRR